MTRFFDPCHHKDTTSDDRLHAPATARNRNVILEVLKSYLPKQGSLLEVAAGTGEHAAFLAPHFPDLWWQPTDIQDKHLKSIEAWRTYVGSNNILPAIYFDAIESDWLFDHLKAPLSTVMAANLLHISPIKVTEEVIKGAGQALGDSGILYLYGPYKRGGKHTSPSNERFDESLKASNPSWGVRDLEYVTELAIDAGFATPKIIDMPANNFSLIFKK